VLDCTSRTCTCHPETMGFTTNWKRMLSGSSSLGRQAAPVQGTQKFLGQFLAFLWHSTAGHRRTLTWRSTRAQPIRGAFFQGPTFLIPLGPIFQAADRGPGANRSTYHLPRRLELTFFRLEFLRAQKVTPLLDL